MAAAVMGLLLLLLLISLAERLACFSSLSSLSWLTPRLVWMDRRTRAVVMVVFLVMFLSWLMFVSLEYYPLFFVF